MDTKRRNGQFFTQRSPFDHPLFREWVSLIPDIGNAHFAEPFAGTNNLIAQSMEQLPGVSLSQWTAHDIIPANDANIVPEVSIVYNDSIANPVSADVIITNPPYLAKNSARRRGMTDVEFGGFGDLFEVSLSGMLDNAPYVAAIIPESFMTRTLFRDRLHGIISIGSRIFDDTDCPVCLAFFVPDASDFVIYLGHQRLGMMSELERLRLPEVPRGRIHHNVPDGELGLYAVDGTSGTSIRYVRGSDIDPGLIKVSSRSITRIHVDDVNVDDILIENLNRAINDMRDKTHDIFLTSFKGLRKDGRYRRRLDWETSSRIIGSVIATR